MDKTLHIKIEDGYLVCTVAGKTARSAVAPVLKGYRKVLDFDRETGELLLEAEFQFPDGRVMIEEEPISLHDILCWAYHRPEAVILNIEVIVLE